MGAISIDVSARGESIKDAFKRAVEDAETELGTDPYNGGINNCELIADWSHKYNGKNLNKLCEEAIRKCNKREVIGICLDKPLPNKNKTKSKVENIPQKGARKWETVYQGVSRGYNSRLGEWSDTVVVEGKTQTECIKKARAYVEKNKHVHLTIKISKRLVSGNVECAVVSYKKSKSEKEGRYLFVGMAPY
jgi:hypothetical protein